MILTLMILAPILLWFGLYGFGIQTLIQIKKIERGLSRKR